MNKSWLNIEWFKRKALHEYQNGGKDNALKYVDCLLYTLSDSDYIVTGSSGFCIEAFYVLYRNSPNQ